MRSVPIITGSAPEAQAISAEEFAAIINPYLPGVLPQIAVAVSGGPDSMALVYCLKRWGKARITALIVDHALRAESAQEAEHTRQNLDKLDIEAEILRWEHSEIVTRIHDAARKARYHLMLEACRRKNIKHLFLAHHRDDQVETILMRFAKGSGIAGLAGMAARRMKDGVTLVRPFLQQRKARLIATCAAASIPFITDPSNASDSFARGRLRRVMSSLESEGLTADRLLDLGERAGEAQQALAYYSHALLRVAVRIDHAGVIFLNLEQLRAAPSAISSLALTHCLQAVHREKYAPERLSLQAILQALIADGDMPARTLNGCLITKTSQDAVIMRELANVTEHTVIRAGESVVWDQRWRVSLTANAGSGSWVIRPLGNPPHEVLERLAPGLLDNVPSGRARAALPTLCHGDEIDLIPAPYGQNGHATAELLTNLFNHIKPA